MPQKLSERPEELLRQFLKDNLRPSEMEGYDPAQTDTQATDYMPVTSNYSKWGETFPMIYVGEQDGPTVPNSGETGYNGQSGDGSGPNIYNIKNITVSCQTTEGGAYLNGVDYDDLAFTLYQEVMHQIQNNAETAISEALFTGITPPTPLRSTTEDDSGDTSAFYQNQGTAQVGFINTP